MAHHGAFEYDLNAVRRYEGVVVEHLWKNPHSLTVLEVQTESEEPLRLEIEGGGPSVLLPEGVTATAIVVGERVTAVVSPSRRFPNRSAYGHEIIKANGEVVPLDRRRSAARSQQKREVASTIFGTWTPRGAERTIYLDGRAHPPATEPFQQGHSVGHWEDEVLVVDTTNFTERIYAGLASSAEKHLVERFSLSDDRMTIEYSFVLDDPEYLAEPVSGTYRWDYRPDLNPSGVECDLELAERYLRELRQ